jgi:hypothetical protein
MTVGEGMGSSQSFLTMTPMRPLPMPSTEVRIILLLFSNRFRDPNSASGTIHPMVLCRWLALTGSENGPLLISELLGLNWPASMHDRARAGRKPVAAQLCETRSP